MSDTSYSVYQHYGTQAERLAFTPVPPQVGGSDVKLIYKWFETDTGNEYTYTTTWNLVSGTASSVGGDLALHRLAGGI